MNKISKFLFLLMVFFSFAVSLLLASLQGLCLKITLAFPLWIRIDDCESQEFRSGAGQLCTLSNGRSIELSTPCDIWYLNNISDIFIYKRWMEGKQM